MGFRPGPERALGEAESLRGRIAMPKPAGVHRNRDEQKTRSCFRQRSTHRRDGLINQPAGCLGRNIYKSRRPEIILSHMVVDDEFLGAERAEESTKIPELVPRSGIK